ncbi:MAG: hypothetical protein Tsb006_4710 [Rickettsiaceae bacterium]
MSLQSQIYVEGVAKLEAALNQQPELTINEIINDCSVELLRDLERVSKRQDLNNKRAQLAEFKPEFYKELEKPADQRSEEYKTFIQSCCSVLTPSRHCTEVISAKALAKFNEPSLEYNELKQSVKSSIAEYKEVYQKQTAADHNRGAILFKGPNGKTSYISVEQLMNSEDVNLSKEQREFINTSWQQGSFFCGWFNGLPESALLQQEGSNRHLIPYNSPNFTQIFIDGSGDKVKVYNRLEVSLINPDTIEIKPFFEASVTADITELKGDSFNPASASGKPEIQFDIKELDESLSLNIPNSLQVSQQRKDVSSYIKKEAAAGYLYMIENGIENDRAWSSINSLMGEEEALNYVIKNADLSNNQLKNQLIARIDNMTVTDGNLSLDSARYSKAVELFNNIETDANKRKGYAEQKLDRYLSAQTSTYLDNKELTYIKNGVIAIMSPSCESNKEKIALEQNADKIIRACAIEKGGKLSFSQKWHRFKDSISDLKNWVIGKENTTQLIMQKHPEIVLKVKQHFSLPKPEDKHLTTPPKKEKHTGPEI